MRKFQQGSSYASFALGVILFCLILKIGAAIGPAYLDDRLINEQISSVVAISNKDMDKYKFIDEITKRFEMNNVRDIKAEEILQVQQTGSGIVVTKKYEVRKNFVANIDLAVTFEKKFDKNSIKN